MHVRARQTDERTDGQTEEHHDNSATIRSMNASRTKKGAALRAKVYYM